MVEETEQWIQVLGNGVAAAVVAHARGDGEEHPGVVVVIGEDVDGEASQGLER